MLLTGAAPTQASARTRNAASTHDQIDRGYLSSSAYTNAYFGFKLRIPPEVEFQELRPTKDLPRGESFLFGLHSRQGGVTGFVITAERSEGTADESAKKIVRRTTENAAQNLHKMTIGGMDFWKGSHSERTSNGLLSRASYAVALNGYVVDFYVSSRNQEIFTKLCEAIEALQFFDPANAKEIAGDGSVAFPRE